MGEAKRRRDAAIRALVEQFGANEDLAAHMYDNQIRTQQLAHEHGGYVALVNTSPDAEGYEVTCGTCPRTARMPSPPPAESVIVCPDCAARRFDG